MARKLSISFKETTKDIELYDYLEALEDRSTEIKEILRRGLKMKSETTKEDKKEKPKNDNDVDILNF